MTRKPLAAIAATLALGAGMGAFASEAAATRAYGGVTFDAKEPYSGSILYGPASFTGTATSNLTVEMWFTQFVDGGWWALGSNWRKQFTILRGQSINTYAHFYNACPAGAPKTYRMEVRIWGSPWDISGARTLGCR